MSDTSSQMRAVASGPVSSTSAFSTLTRVFSTYSVSWRKALGVVVLGAIFVGLMGQLAASDPPTRLEPMSIEDEQALFEEGLDSLGRDELAGLSEEQVQERVSEWVREESLRRSPDAPTHDLGWDVAIMLTQVGLGILVPLICLLCAVPALGSPRSDHALSYVWLSGTALWVVPAAGLAAALAIALPLSTGVMLAASLAAKGTAAVHAGVLIGSIFGAVAWCSIAVLASLMLGRPLIWGLAYVIAVEPFLAGDLTQSTPLGALSVSRYVTSPIKSWITIPDDGDFAGSAVSPTVAVIVMLAVAVAAIAAAAWRLSRMTVDE